MVLNTCIHTYSSQRFAMGNWSNFLESKRALQKIVLMCHCSKQNCSTETGCGVELNEAGAI